MRACLDAFDGTGPIVVLANREPIRHDRAADGRIVVRRSASGLVTALEPLIESCSGVWVAHGAGTADRVVVDWRDGLDVPPANPLYRLRRVWLNEREERGYYYGFANEGLWPLCHRTHVRPVFRSEDFDAYQNVNRRFAEAVHEEVESDSPLILVQDYHFALAPQAIRAHLPLSTIVAFWHIPWPHPRDYAVCPWGRELLEGLLGSTIVGFQTPGDCENFIETVEYSLDAHIDRGRNVIAYGDRRVTVHAYPVSVEWPNRLASQSPPVETCRAVVRRQLPPDVRLAVGVDRLDYTKGINEKFLAVERLLELHSEFRERFVFVQIAEPSRECLAAYQACRSQLAQTVDRVNLRFGTDRYRPLILLEAHHEPAEVYQFLRAADVCYVGSLHDGMNLVAKEFVAARDDNQGVLVLSRFTGAARELTDALLVSPFAIDDSAQVLARALDMTPEEQASRMRAMRAVVAEFNAYRWVVEMLTDAARLRANRDLRHYHEANWRADTLPAQS
ncbi:MAG: trehalose-6-phosphate synthase [Acidobacteria bacterium]|nr:trehalose-6-phosphate synthase [Acidobacteriota bacterium]